MPDANAGRELAATARHRPAGEGGENRRSGFWARHPRILDVLVVATAVFFASPWFFFLPQEEEMPVAENVVSGCVLLLASLVLLLRRRFPVAVCVATVVPVLVLPSDATDSALLLPAFGLYAVAVNRPRRAAWVAFATVSGSAVLATLVRRLGSGEPIEMELWNVLLIVVVHLVGVLAGANTRARHRALAEIVERSRQLARERDQRARLAAVEERTRIAREMHDIVAHSLTVIVALSEGMAVAPASRIPEASRLVAATARSALTEMRAMLGVLRDGDSDSSPLEPLEPTDPATVVRAAQSAGFPVVLHWGGDITRVSRQVRFALGRLVQEGVTNAMRHAPNATRIGVFITVRDDGVEVRVENDGVGTRPSPSVGGGFGIRGLQERVLSVGGSVTSSRAGHGTWALRAILPLSPTDGQDPS